MIDICQCPACGRSHRPLFAGEPPLSILDDIIKAATNYAALRLIDKEARLDCERSPYHGRLGVIKGVVPDVGGILALLMIYKVGTKELLNDRPDSRSYWRIARLSFEGGAP